ncbi:ATP-grasp fold amidoligase family protein [Lysobacter sp. D1-1-M9]|uniref:ATP-grasp fold amidoligase family protein n=1 Tax=Novilysobacter longmucuonensis TaxID=3098603 RepID=UPI002FCC9E7B
MIEFSKTIKRLATRAVPRGRSGDRVLALLKFVATHRRLPSKKLSFSDELYRIKVEKLSDPLRTFVSDKEYLKIYVTAEVGANYAVPTVAVLRSPREVYEYSFPEFCCIKPTHASGKVLFRQHGESLDLDEIASWFDYDYYRVSREANYEKLQRKVIVEPLIFNGVDITDYRFFCYGGEPRLITLDIGKYSGYMRAFFDAEWNEQNFSLHYPQAPRGTPRPANLEEMLVVARKLSSGFDFVRVDIYSNGVSCLVGEITNCHASVRQRFSSPDAEELASRIIFGSPSGECEQAS